MTCASCVGRIEKALLKLADGIESRAEEFIQPRYHLTEAEHRERTAKWA